MHFCPWFGTNRILLIENLIQILVFFRKQNKTGSGEGEGKKERKEGEGKSGRERKMFVPKMEKQGIAFFQAV